VTGAVLHVDFETYSECDLAKAGAYAYAAHPSTDILCMAMAVDDMAPVLWLPGQALPEWLYEHVLLGRRVVAWNAPFERLIWRHVGVAKYGFPVLDDAQIWCAAAQGANMALPRDLGGAAAALGAAAQKDSNGRRVMLKLSKPRKPTKHNPATRWTPENAPEDFATLYEYCRQDVRAERDICGRLYALSDAERRMYLLDQVINDRGVRIDRSLISAAQAVVEQTLTVLDAELAALTGGEVTAATQTAKLVTWLYRNGVMTDSVAADVVTGLLERAERFPPAAVRALEIRQEAAKSSTAKLVAMLVAAGADDRIRGSLLYYGAKRTGRWSGRLHQPQNFPRGDEAILDDVAGAVAALMTGNADHARLLYGNPMLVVSTCLRLCMWAAEGHDMMAVDFANIEGRVLAWLAGEHWKVQAFRDYDGGTGPDLYKATYARCFGIDVDAVTKPMRQVGKVIELACGYQGWTGAFQTFAKLYGIKVSDDEAAKLAGAWREAHPAIAGRQNGLWARLNDATLQAVATPGRRVTVCPVTWLCSGGYLWCRLPNGRVLAYCQPTIEQNDRGEPAVHFWGEDSYTRRWQKQSGYGGLWTENIVQAISRDLLAEAMLRLEAAGYALVLTVHDELVAEVPHGFGSVPEMESIAAELPTWATGLPVAAAGWRDRRYKK
jgi:DNA polymerase